MKFSTFFLFALMAAHGDSVLRHLEGNAAGKRFKRCLACSIGDLPGKNLCSVRGKVDDPSKIASVADRFSNHKNASPYIDRKGIVDQFWRDNLYGIKPVFPALSLSNGRSTFFTPEPVLRLRVQTPKLSLHRSPVGYSPL